TSACASERSTRLRWTLQAAAKPLRSIGSGFWAWLGSDPYGGVIRSPRSTQQVPRDRAYYGRRPGAAGVRPPIGKEGTGPGASAFRREEVTGPSNFPALPVLTTFRQVKGSVAVTALRSWRVRHTGEGGIDRVSDDLHPVEVGHRIVRDRDCPGNLVADEPER